MVKATVSKVVGLVGHLEPLCQLVGCDRVDLRKGAKPGGAVATLQRSYLEEELVWRLSSSAIRVGGAVLTHQHILILLETPARVPRSPKVTMR
ncbi:uncharacterized protein J3R85_008083 [Psidium guajava]|nr:uncharacterized protein J3R85_008083 [Psidium guajava]